MIYISFGSNLGHRLKNLHDAINALIKNDIIYNVASSIIIETQALLKPNSPDDWNKPYLNCIICCNTKFTPEELLEECKKIEIKLGRGTENINHEVSENKTLSQEEKKWAPRIIDIDLLSYDDLEINNKNLTIPHIELFNRPFLLHLIAMLDYKYQQGKSKYLIRNEAHNNIITSNISFTKSYSLKTKLMGILNITPDSFSDGGKFLQTDKAITHLHKLIDDGAYVIDIGAESTRPNAQKISSDEECKRLNPILDYIYSNNINRNILISIDSYHTDTIYNILSKYPIDWINDVSGNLSDKTLKYIAEQGKKIVIMHSNSIPVRKNEIMEEEKENIITQIIKWGERQIEKLSILGFDKEQIILDPGIGFGKSIYQNLEIIRNIDEIKKLECEILVGHSRKSFIKAFNQNNFDDKDLETAILSVILTKNSVDYIRVHNVKQCHQAIIASEICSSQDKN